MPWLLLDATQRAVLALTFAFCPSVSLLRAASVCRAWCLVSDSRAAWRGSRLTFGWGLDSEMHGLLRAMRRVAIKHDLAYFPEELRFEDKGCCSPPSSPQSRISSPSSSSPCSPSGSPVGSKVRGGTWSPLASATITPMLSTSPLLLVRHSTLWPEYGALSPLQGHRRELWLLQPETDRHQSDPPRRILCRYLAQNPEWISGKVVLEVNSASGLVGLFTASAAKAVTITTSAELGSRLVKLNGTMAAEICAGPAARRSGAPKRQRVILQGQTASVPVYIYTMAMTERGIQELRRKWEWDSGSAMRGLRMQLASPCFDVILAASIHSEAQAHQLLVNVGEFLIHKGVIVAALPENDDALLVLRQQASACGYQIVVDTTVRDEWDGIVQVLILRSLFRSSTR